MKVTMRRGKREELIAFVEGNLFPPQAVSALVENSAFQALAATAQSQAETLEIARSIETALPEPSADTEDTNIPPF
jgi:hypothetical protein